MGYRSDVAYKIKFGSKEIMSVFLAEAKAKEETRIVFEGGNENRDVEIDEDKLFIRFEGRSWKWYSEYPEVQAHEAVMEMAREYNEAWEGDVTDLDKLNEPNKEVQYAFARIGEEMDDNEHFASDDGYDLVYISRSIMFDYD